MSAQALFSFNAHRFNKALMNDIIFIGYYIVMRKYFSAFLAAQQFTC